MRSTFIANVLTVAALLAAGACGRSRTITTGDGTVTYKQKGKDGATSMTFTGKNGEKVTMDVNAGKLPSDYPSDVPVYKEAKITVAQTVSEKNGRNLVMETADPADKVVAFYKTGLESNGWKIEGTVAVGELNMITATKANKQFAVQINKSGEQQMITQTVTDK